MTEFLWDADNVDNIEARIEIVRERLYLANDALLYLYSLQEKEDCTCNPAGGDMCKFCQRQKRYKLFIEKEGLIK